jgi:flagellar hook-associated protein FlgK
MKKFEEFKSSLIGDEQGMIKSQLSDMVQNLNYIVDNLESMGDDIPAWVQDKVSMSNQNIKDIISWYNSKIKNKKYEVVKEV